MVDGAESTTRRRALKGGSSHSPGCLQTDIVTSLNESVSRPEPSHDDMTERAGPTLPALGDALPTTTPSACCPRGLYPGKPVRRDGLLAVRNGHPPGPWLSRSLCWRGN